MTNYLQNFYNNKIILASQSPRRASLLSLIGFDFVVQPSGFDESLITETNPVQHVLQLSEAKARFVADNTDKGLVIGADTIVVLDNTILGKPENTREAVSMLKQLSNRTHHVYTGFCLIEKPENRSFTDYEVTAVHFRKLADWEIEGYVGTQNPMDKAGAYGIQDQSAVFADRIEGCFYNVVGFPLTKFYTTMINFFNKNKNI